jgi:hypothetical protein
MLNLVQTTNIGANATNCPISNTKKRNFPVKFPVNSPKQGKPTLAYSRSEQNSQSIHSLDQGKYLARKGDL